jgi:hypothetical protein
LQRQREQQGKWRNRIIFAAIGVVAVAVAVFAIVRSQSSGAGRFVQIQGATHIEKGVAHAPYNSSPPTSGPHWNIGGEAPVAWGIYKEPIPNEAQIHNLEHGGIMIQYNCPEGCSDLVQQLEDFYTRYSAENKLPLYPNSSKLVVAPYRDMPSRIALTAWGRIDTFDQYDEARIKRFVDEYRDKGPEKTP